MKFKSRSLRVVVGSISDSGLSVRRPWEEPFKSKRLWMAYSVRNRFPMITNRTWLDQSHYGKNGDLNMVKGVCCYYLLLCSAGQLNAMKTVKFGDECVFKCPDVLIVSGKHPDKHLLKNKLLCYI